MMSVPRTHVVHIISAVAEGGGALVRGRPANFVCGNVDDPDGFWEDAPLPIKAYHLPPTATVVLLEGSESVYGTVAGLIKRISDNSQMNAVIITDRAGDLTTIEEMYHP
jgi:hypothetical protein